MKTVTRDFWVSIQCINDLKTDDPGYYFSKSPCGSFKNKITISFEIPDRKVEISESDFEEKLRKSVPINWTDELIEEISRRFFGDK